MHTAFPVDPEVIEPPPVSLSAPDFYSVDLDSKGGWNLLYVVPPGQTEVRSSLQADFPDILAKCVEYSIEASTTAAGVF